MMKLAGPSTKVLDLNVIRVLPDSRTAANFNALQLRGPLKNSGWWQIGPSPNYSQVSYVTVAGAYRYRSGFVAWSGSFVTRSGSHGGLV